MTTATADESRQRNSYDLTNGRDELNVADFPLFYLGQRIPAHLKTLRYEQTVYDSARNKTHKKKLEIAGSDAYGLPTVTDADVLLALLLIAKQSNDFSDATVAFSRYEIIEVLGWDHSGKSYRRLNEALKKWKAVTLFFDGGWWDKENTQWITEGFNVLDHIKINHGQQKRGQPDLKLSSCTFSKRFFSSLHSGNIKRLNLTELFSLKLPTAKQMYRVLDKRFYNTSTLDFDLREFACEHVGLSRNYAPSKLKDKLKPAIAELVTLGFISDMPMSDRYSKVSHGEWRIHFKRSRRVKLTETLPGNRAERAAARLLIKELTDRGMTASTAQSLVTNQSYSHAHIFQKIEMLDWLIESNPSKAPKQRGGWLAKAIKDNYQPTSDFKSRAEREHTKREAEKRQQQLLFAKAKRDAEEQLQREESESKSNEEWSRVESFLASLESDKREMLIEEAIEAHNPMNYARKYRLNPEPDSGPEIIYREALKKLVLPMIDVEAKV